LTFLLIELCRKLIEVTPRAHILSETGLALN
jgi:hypothetical protein